MHERKPYNLITLAAMIALQCIWVLPATAQWKEQTFTLKPGWNAINLEVNPVPNDCASVFSGVPVESVWAWNRRFETVQFIQNANELTPEQQEWLVYFPESSSSATATTLFAIHSRPLLIKLAGSSEKTITIKGTPSIDPVDWVSNSFNLVGFHLSPTSPPSVANFTSLDAALVKGPVHRLAENGAWEVIKDPATQKMRSGEAYWIYCDGTTSYNGGIEVLPELGQGLTFGQSLVEQVLTIRNTSPTSRTVSIAALPSAAAPASEEAVAGSVALYYWLFSDKGTWLPLGTNYSVTIPGGAEERIRLEARRSEFAANGAGGAFQSLVRVTDNTGLSIDVPVSANGIGSTGAKGATPVHPRAGLWIGTVNVNKVNFVSNPDSAATDTPLPTAAEFQFRVLIHVDASGAPRLLQEVIQMWKNGTRNSDGTTAAPGEFVLLTNDSKISSFSGATLRDGTPAGRRFSSAAFGFHEPITMSGTFSTLETPESSISCEVLLPHDDALNPFYHRYHPDHDNLDFSFVPYSGDVEQESYTVTRKLKFNFTQEDPDGLSIAGWGDTQIGGSYEESIEGIHKEVLHVGGAFRLQHASTITELNPEPRS
jgi:hypothetical protein